MTTPDRLRVYLSAQHRAESLRRASNYVFLAILVIVLAGSGVGLFPEFETTRSLQAKEMEALTRVSQARASLEAEQKRLDHLSSDVEFMELHFRNGEQRAAKPGEVLILIPPERQVYYERKAAGAGPLQ